MGFNCQRCGACCARKGTLLLYPQDVESLSSFLNVSACSFVREYCEAFQLETEERSFVVLLLRQQEGCPFLTEDALCSVHEVKPMQCKLAPTSYFCSLGFWRNCILHGDCSCNPFESGETEISDEFFVRAIMNGYGFCSLFKALDKSERHENPAARS